jgi:hypothetical protein
VSRRHLGPSHQTVATRQKPCTGTVHSMYCCHSVDRCTHKADTDKSASTSMSLEAAAVSQHTCDENATETVEGTPQPREHCGGQQTPIHLSRTTLVQIRRNCNLI